MKFCDLHLCPPLKDFEAVEKMIRSSYELGYEQIAVPLPTGVKDNVVERLRQVSREIGVDFVTRLDLTPRGPGELLESLRRFRRRFEVVSVLCGSKLVARQAAKDRRVDLLCFPSVDPRRRFFGLAEAELASASSAALEIDMVHILSSEGLVRVGLLSSLMREVSTAVSFRVPVVISSGAADPLLLRKPLDCASLAFLFDMDLSLAVKALSETPVSLVERNREKQGSGYVSPGVRVVKGAANSG